MEPVLARNALNTHGLPNRVDEMPRIRRVVRPLVTFGLAALIATTTGYSQVPKVPASKGCEPAALGRIMALPQARLKAETNSGLSRESAEGRTTTVYYEGSIPRIVSLTDLGETGRAETTFFVLDTLNFLVWRQEHEYRNAISSRTPAQIARTRQAVQLICGGTAVSGLDSLEASQLVVRLSAALRSPRSK